MTNLFSFTLQVSSEEHQESSVGEPSKRYGMTAGGQVREEELMASLQMLLEKVEKGQFATGPGESKSIYRVDWVSCGTRPTLDP